MKLTPQQSEAVSQQGHAYIDACPGSGKTRVLTAKAISECPRVQGSPRKIACMTFTTAAADEVQTRLASRLTHEQLSSVTVCTIHSFCLNEIFRPFRERLDAYAQGFEIVVNDDARARQLLADIAQGAGFSKPDARMYEAFAGVNIDTNGNPIVSGGQPLLKKCMPIYWDSCRQRGWIDFSLLLYESLKILSNYPEVRASLAAKFKIILVDEFQDTSEIQLEILRQIREIATSDFFLVGDPHQSIYRFAGASPESSQRFVVEIGADCSHPLSGNFRSSDEIVAMAEQLLPRNPAMKAVGENAKKGVSAQVFTSPSMPRAITEHFLPMVSGAGISYGACAVLAAWWTDLLPVARACSQAGIPVIGPGARPYRRGRLIVPLLENLAAAATSYVSLAATQRALMRAVNEIEGGDTEGFDGWLGRLFTLTLQQHAQQLLRDTPNAIDWILALGAVIDALLLAREIDTHGAFEMSAKEIQADLHARHAKGEIDMTRLSVGELGLFANPQNAIKLLTVHAAKGREFEAVAVIGMNEGRFPHFSASTAAAIEDGRRSAYVAMTRAKRLLNVYVDTSDSRNPPSRFIAP
jgi:DNA helicase II / ATP-dependent DNA helicase PcrA